MNKSRLNLIMNPPDNQKYIGELFDVCGRKFFYLDDLDKKIDSSTSKWNNKNKIQVDRGTANLVSSYCYDGYHRPVLDFDFPARLIPSSTPGHTHLYIDEPIHWNHYKQILIAMRGAGLLQDGFVNNCIDQDATFVRPPWIKKP